MTKTAIELSNTQARKIVLLSQGIHQAPSDKSSKATLKTITRLGYVQIDTISVVERAHHHCLWSRMPHYQPTDLEQLQQQGLIFEYWAHAAAYLPMADYRYSLVRKNAIASGEKHWFDKDQKLAQQVLARIREQGPLQAKDFEHQGDSNNGWWQWKPAKKALEQLFMEGRLMVVKRQGFQKVYDLTERVLPAHIDCTVPSDEEYHRYLIKRFLQANGIATPEQMRYLRKGLGPALTRQCQQMLADAELQRVRVAGRELLALPGVDQLLGQKLSRSRVQILSPFDNLLIQRARTKALFDFDYQIECYLPEQKRKYGYFCLPLLWGQHFAGRMDAKMDRKTGVLQLKHLHLETPKTEAFVSALKPALQAFLAFNRGERIAVQKISSAGNVLSRSSELTLAKMLTD